MNEALGNLHENSKMPMTPLPGSTSVPDSFFFPPQKSLMLEKQTAL